MAQERAFLSHRRELEPGAGAEKVVQAQEMGHGEGGPAGCPPWAFST